VLELKTVDGADPGWRLAEASSFFARFRGLMGRPSLAQGEGLFLPGTNSIHMLFMRFPIDCLFVGAPRPDGTREVVGMREHLNPWRGVVWWARGARGAVEVPAGSLAAAGLRRGDYVRLEPAS
jgi:uncharacterized membrane protein (UPF0127 family)